MKKMLAMLFLLFYLNTNTTYTSLADYIPFSLSEEKISEIIRHTEILNNVLDIIEEKDSVTQICKDSIPILSPIKMSEILSISSDYGMRIHPIYNDWRFHKGLDIATKRNTEVFSTADGVVYDIEYSKYGYGNQIIIKHSNGYMTRYAHLEKINVNIGDNVTHHTVIGLVGNTGLTTGIHLHYEILKDGNAIDPAFFTYKSSKDRSIEKYKETVNSLEFS